MHIFSWTIVGLPTPLLLYYLVASYVYQGYYLKGSNTDRRIDRTLSWLIVIVVISILCKRLKLILKSEIVSINKSFQLQHSTALCPCLPQLWHFPVNFPCDTTSFIGACPDLSLCNGTKTGHFCYLFCTYSWSTIANIELSSSAACMAAFKP